MSDLEFHRRLRLPDVMRLTGFSKSEIYRRAKDGRLPKQHRESHRVSYWLAGELRPYLVKTSGTNPPSTSARAEALLA